MPDSPLMEDFARSVAVHAMGCMYWKYCRILRWVPRRLARKIEDKLKADLIASVEAAVSDVAHIHRVSICRDRGERSMPGPSRN